jgi:hypothetical protein
VAEEARAARALPQAGAPAAWVAVEAAAVPAAWVVLPQAEAGAARLSAGLRVVDLSAAVWASRRDQVLPWAQPAPPPAACFAHAMSSWRIASL